MMKRQVSAILTGFALGGLAGIGALQAALHMPVIGQRGKVFSIGEMNVPKGATIRISNDDDVLHTLRVTYPDGTRRDHGVQKPGETTDITLAHTGAHTVRCNIHPAMKMVVNVR
jgi:plastocyanin